MLQVSTFTVALVTVAVSAAVLPRQSEDITQAAPSRYIFAFGNSYTTQGFNISGNKPSVATPYGNPTYPGNTLAGGGTWVEHIVHDHSPAGTVLYNFAVSGAAVNNSKVDTGVPSMINQVSLFEQNVANKPAYAPWTSANSAFAVWFGINDIGRSYAENYNATTFYGQIQHDYFNQLKLMCGHGARRFMLLNVPPTQRTPMFMNTPSAEAVVPQDISTWNSLLSKNAATFQNSGCGTGTAVQILNTQPIFNNILNNPKQYGAPNNSCYNSDGTSCLWWNNYHPGQAIQSAVGTAAAQVLQNEGFYG